MEYSGGFTSVVKLTVKRGKEALKKKKASHISDCGERTVLPRYSLGFELRGEKTGQIAPHRKIKGMQNKEGFREKNTEHLRKGF